MPDYATISYSNFRAPDLIWKKFPGVPNIKGTYKNCRKIKRKFRFYDTSVVLNLSMDASAGMAPNNYKNYIQHLRDTRFLILLILILSLLVLTPFLDDFVQTRILMDVFLTVIFVFIINTIRLDRSQAILATILALPLIVTIWSIYFVEVNTLSLLTRIFGALFFAYAAVNTLRIIARSEKVTRETIFAAIVAYLMIALMWAFLYMILEITSPGSFSFPEQGHLADAMRFQYFSFITITTLGYGDITPLTNKASALALIEALVGQIYMVVLVAWLVGMHVSRRSK